MIQTKAKRIRTKYIKVILEKGADPSVWSKTALLLGPLNFPFRSSLGSEGLVSPLLLEQ